MSTGGLARRAGIVAAGTLASRILGALRDTVIAATFPLVATDVFFLAFVIPNSLRVILAEGAMSGAFVPTFAAVREQEGEQAAKGFVSRFSGSMLVILLAVTALGVVFAEGFVYAFASGYGDRPEVFEMAVRTTRVVFPYVIFMGLGALATGALQSVGRFAPGAFAPSLLNVSFLLVPFTLLPLGHRLGIDDTTVLALAALVGGALQLLALLPALRSEGLLVLPRPAFGDPWVKKGLLLLVPMLVGLGVYELNVALSRQFLSHLPDGSMSFVYYAQRLVEIPQGMFALAIGSASLPAIAKASAKGELDEAKSHLREALRMTWFVALPSSVVLVLLAEPIVRVLLGHGVFEEASVRATSLSLVLQGLGVVAIASVRTLVPMFHGLRDTRTPVVGSAVNLVTFVACASLLLPRMGHLAIALALSLAGAAQAGVLALRLRGKTGQLDDGTLARALGKTVVAGIGAGVVLRLGLGAVPTPVSFVAAISTCVAGGLAYGVLYLGALTALGADEPTRLADALRRRLGRVA